MKRESGDDFNISLIKCCEKKMKINRFRWEMIIDRMMLSGKCFDAFHLPRSFEQTRIRVNGFTVIVWAVWFVDRINHRDLTNSRQIARCESLLQSRTEERDSGAWAIGFIKILVIHFAFVRSVILQVVFTRCGVICERIRVWVIVERAVL